MSLAIYGDKFWEHGAKKGSHFLGYCIKQLYVNVFKLHLALTFSVWPGTFQSEILKWAVPGAWGPESDLFRMGYHRWCRYNCAVFQEPVPPRSPSAQSGASAPPFKPQPAAVPVGGAWLLRVYEAARKVLTDLCHWAQTQLFQLAPALKPNRTLRHFSPAGPCSVHAPRLQWSGSGCAQESTDEAYLGYRKPSLRSLLCLI